MSGPTRARPLCGWLNADSCMCSSQVRRDPRQAHKAHLCCESWKDGDGRDEQAGGRASASCRPSQRVWAKRELCGRRVVCGAPVVWPSELCRRWWRSLWGRPEQADRGARKLGYAQLMTGRIALATWTHSPGWSWHHTGPRRRGAPKPSPRPGAQVLAAMRQAVRPQVLVAPALPPPARPAHVE